MNTQAICDKIAAKHGVNKTLVRSLYKYYWKFVAEKIVEMDLTKEYTQEEFEKTITSVSVPCIGKIACTWSVYQTVSNQIKYIKDIRNGQHKEDKEDSSNV